VDFLQGLMLAVVVGVWVLIYKCWQEVDIYVMLEDGEAPPLTLLELRTYNKAMQSIPIPGGVIYEEERGREGGNSKQ